MRVWVDRPTSSCLGLHCTFPVPPGPPLSTIRDGPNLICPSVSERRRATRDHRGDAIVSTTWRWMRMRLRRTIGLSLVLLVVSATAMAKQAHSGDDRALSRDKPTPAKADANAKK